MGPLYNSRQSNTIYKPHNDIRTNRNEYNRPLNLLSLSKTKDRIRR